VISMDPRAISAGQVFLRKMNFCKDLESFLQKFS